MAIDVIADRYRNIPCISENALCELDYRVRWSRCISRSQIFIHFVPFFLVERFMLIREIFYFEIDGRGIDF